MGRGQQNQFDERWATDNMELVRSNATSLLERKPDIVVAIGGRVIPILKQMTHSVRSSWRAPSIRSAPAWSQAWRVREAILRDSR
jgi:hypothetical protein